MTGLYYVVFGKEFEKLAIATISYSRRFTKLPILIITNISDLDKKWGSITDISIKFVDAPNNENRYYKTNADLFSIFYNTVYLDADSIITKETFDNDIKKMFDSDCDLILNKYCKYPDNNKFQNIYLRAYNQFNCSGILNVYNGAFIGFKKNEKTSKFFKTWFSFWSMFGKQREMPPLACAINKVDKIKIFELPFGYFNPDTWDKSCVVQHQTNTVEFWEAIGIEPFHVPETPYQVDDYKFSENF